jgi:hypothetical protein
VGRVVVIYLFIYYCGSSRSSAAEVLSGQHCLVGGDGMDGIDDGGEGGGVDVVCSFVGVMGAKSRGDLRRSGCKMKTSASSCCACAPRVLTDYDRL